MPHGPLAALEGAQTEEMASARSEEPGAHPPCLPPVLQRATTSSVSELQDSQRDLSGKNLLEPTGEKSRDLGNPVITLNKPLFGLLDGEYLREMSRNLIQSFVLFLRGFVFSPFERTSQGAGEMLFNGYKQSGKRTRCEPSTCQPYCPSNLSPAMMNIRPRFFTH